MNEWYISSTCRVPSYNVHSAVPTGYSGYLSVIFNIFRHLVADDYQGALNPCLYVAGKYH